MTECQHTRVAGMKSFGSAGYVSIVWIVMNLQFINLDKLLFFIHLNIESFENMKKIIEYQSVIVFPFFNNLTLSNL